MQALKYIPVFELNKSRADLHGLWTSLRTEKEIPVELFQTCSVFGFVFIFGVFDHVQSPFNLLLPRLSGSFEFLNLQAS